MALDPEALLGRVIGSYTVDSLIGSGTFAWVFAAHGADGGPAVALKIMRPRYAGDQEFETRFRNEFQVAAHLRHPNVIRIVGMGHDQGFTYFAMDHCTGTLADRVKDGGPMADAELVPVARDVARALGFAHDAGVIHRDIKPDNIMFGPDGRTVLADFGIARAVSAFVRATGAHMTIGTPHYVSPEQAQGSTMDGRSDLYSLGVTLYKATTGILPFRATDWFELARLHVEQPPVPPRVQRPDMAPGLDEIILTLLAKHPDDRYPTAAALGAALETLEDTLPAGPVPRDAPRVAPDHAPRPNWTLRAVVLVVVVAAVVAVLRLG